MNNPKAVVCLETGRTYASVGEAAKDNYISYSAIVAACGGRRKTAAGKHWKYTDDYRAIIRAEVRSILEADPVFMAELQKLKELSV